MSYAQQALEYFQEALGLTANQAAGIVGNLYGESRLNPRAVGDGGLAYGIAQWHPDRQANFAKQFGKSIRNSTFQEQLQFVAWEFRNTERAALSDLLKQNTVAQATESVMRKYERPAAWAAAKSLPDRIAAAVKVVGGDASALDIVDVITKGIPGIAGVIGKSVGGSAADTVTGAVNGIESVFNGELASRIVAIAVGIILIGLAIAAFVFSSDKAKEVVKVVAMKGAVK